uniref:HYR domain-containing protein n=1 Tax=Chromera velia CCMP2878 TaxID=1169474 RepID=A0A0G4GEC1_9ALVE|eukprot:Cvel_4575.t1-p1 / transcript=Cvel_4575.t1 / gene=Cvel_4575 / organism=Chromera_velia_CCMP2878 / gene_product=P-selectin, putative / transcript_product=P-selectin, putative / location=Cvel_scaffold201:15306-46816(+) / protein_length=3158 / sequence_SO=supercontig / SO=protein_coding / is_pseudo=false
MKANADKRIFREIQGDPVVHAYFDAAFVLATYGARLGYAIRDCGTPPAADPNGDRTFIGTLLNDRAVYTCNQGYFLRGEDTLVCENGTTPSWSPTLPPVCNAATCPDLPTLTDGSIVYTPASRAFPSNATFTCNDGYYLTTTNTSTFLDSCVANSTGVFWPSQELPFFPACNSLFCPNSLTIPTNGNLTFTPTSRLYQATATYSCDDGYELTAPGGATYTITGPTYTDTCTATGVTASWPTQTQQPTCQAVTCPASIGAPTDGSIVFSPASRLFEATATYACDDGYELTAPGGATYTITGPTYTDTCTATGVAASWPTQTQQPTCELITCPANLVAPVNGGLSFLPASRLFPATATFTCNDGYQLTAPGGASYTITGTDYTDTCGATGSVGFWPVAAEQPTCDPVTCPASIGAPTDGSIVFSPASRLFEATATYACDDGYELTAPGGATYTITGPTYTDTCTATGVTASWPSQGQEPTCELITCPLNLLAPVNGGLSFLPASRLFPATATFTCNDGYQLTAPGGASYTITGTTYTDTCGATGAVGFWPVAAEQPTCDPITCPLSIAAPTNGNLVFSPVSRLYQATATYSCDDGYQLTAPGGATYTITGPTYTDTCTATGVTASWPSQGQEPTCEGVTCPLTISAPTDGTLAFSPLTRVYPATATFGCTDGYQLTAPGGASYTITGTSYTDTCAATGVMTSWPIAAEQPTCEPVLCPTTIAAPTDGALAFLPVTREFPATATYSCDVGYQLTAPAGATYTITGATYTDTCTALGVVTSWPTDTQQPTCEAVPCPNTLTAPLNGNLAYSPTTRLFPATATYSCNSGYQLTAPGGATYTITGPTYTDTCTAVGMVTSWPLGGQEPSCQAVACPGVPAPTNGFVSTTNGGVFPSDATFTCGFGYVLTAAVGATYTVTGPSYTDSCTATGSVTSWPAAGLEPTCERAPCNEATDPQPNALIGNGARVATSTPAGSLGDVQGFDYTCQNGYRLTTPTTPGDPEITLDFTCVGVAVGVAEWQLNAGFAMDGCTVRATCDEATDPDPNVVRAQTFRTNTPTGQTGDVVNFQYGCSPDYMAASSPTVITTSFLFPFTCTGDAYNSAVWAGALPDPACIDVDECFFGLHACDLSISQCVNEPGTFRCDDGADIVCPDATEIGTDAGRADLEMTTDVVDTLPAGSAFDLSDGVIVPEKLLDGGLIGSILSVGDAFSVVLSAVDSAGNNSTCTYTVTVADLEAPLIVCTSVVNAIEVLGVAPSVFFPAAIAQDNVDGRLVPTYSAENGTQFGDPVTVVTATAEDSAGNAATCDTLILVDICRFYFVPNFGNDRTEEDYLYWIAGLCAECPQNANCTGVTRYPTALVLPCPIDTACRAGRQELYQANDPGTDCLFGMKGPLCDECIDGFNSQIPTQPCQGCPSATMTPALIMGGYAVAFTIVALLYTMLIVTSEPEQDMQDHKVMIKQLFNYFNLISTLTSFQYYRISTDTESISKELQVPKELLAFRIQDVIPVKRLPALHEFLSMLCVAEKNFGATGDVRVFISNMLQAAIPVLVYIVVIIFSLLLVFVFRRLRRKDAVVSALKSRTFRHFANGRVKLNSDAEEESVFDHTGTKGFRQSEKKRGSLAGSVARSTLNSLAFLVGKSKPSPSAAAAAAENQSGEKEVVSPVQQLNPAVSRQTSVVSPAPVSAIDGPRESVVSGGEGDFDGASQQHRQRRGSGGSAQSEPGLPPGVQLLRSATGRSRVEAQRDRRLELLDFIAFFSTLKMKKAQFLRNFSFLLGGYADEFFYWETVIMIRKLTLQLVIAYPIVMDDSDSRTFLIIFHAAFFLIIQLWNKPYQQKGKDVLNKMEALSLVSWILIIILFSGMYLFNPAARWIVFLSTMMTVFLLMYVVPAIFLIADGFIREILTKSREISRQDWDQVKGWKKLLRRSRIDTCLLYCFRCYTQRTMTDVVRLQSLDGDREGWFLLKVDSHRQVQQRRGTQQRLNLEVSIARNIISREIQNVLHLWQAARFFFVKGFTDGQGPEAKTIRCRKRLFWSTREVCVSHPPRAAEFLIRLGMIIRKTLRKDPEMASRAQEDDHYVEFKSFAFDLLEPSRDRQRRRSTAKGRSPGGQEFSPARRNIQLAVPDASRGLQRADTRGPLRTSFWDWPLTTRLRPRQGNTPRPRRHSLATSQLRSSFTNISERLRTPRQPAEPRWRPPVTGFDEEKLRFVFGGPAASPRGMGGDRAPYERAQAGAAYVVTGRPVSAPYASAGRLEEARGGSVGELLDETANGGLTFGDSEDSSIPPAPLPVLVNGRPGLLRAASNLLQSMRSRRMSSATNLNGERENRGEVPPGIPTDAVTISSGSSVDPGGAGFPPPPAWNSVPAPLSARRPVLSRSQSRAESIRTDARRSRFASQRGGRPAAPGRGGLSSRRGMAASGRQVSFLSPPTRSLDNSYVDVEDPPPPVESQAPPATSHASAMPLEMCSEVGGEGKEERLPREEAEEEGGGGGGPDSTPAVPLSLPVEECFDGNVLIEGEGQRGAAGGGSPYSIAEEGDVTSGQSETERDQSLRHLKTLRDHAVFEFDVDEANPGGHTRGGGARGTEEASEEIMKEAAAASPPLGVRERSPMHSFALQAEEMHAAEPGDPIDLAAEDDDVVVEPVERSREQSRQTRRLGGDGSRSSQTPRDQQRRTHSSLSLPEISVSRNSGSGLEMHSVIEGDQSFLGSDHAQQAAWGASGSIWKEVGVDLTSLLALEDALVWLEEEGLREMQRQTQPDASGRRPSTDGMDADPRSRACRSLLMSHTDDLDQLAAIGEAFFTHSAVKKAKHKGVKLQRLVEAVFSIKAVDPKVILWLYPVFLSRCVWGGAASSCMDLESMNRGAGMLWQTAGARDEERPLKSVPYRSQSAGLSVVSHPQQRQPQQVLALSPDRFGSSLSDLASRPAAEGEGEDAADMGEEEGEAPDSERAEGESVAAFGQKGHSTPAEWFLGRTASGCHRGRERERESQAEGTQRGKHLMGQRIPNRLCSRMRSFSEPPLRSRDDQSDSMPIPDSSSSVEFQDSAVTQGEGREKERKSLTGSGQRAPLSVVAFQWDQSGAVSLGPLGSACEAPLQESSDMGESELHRRQFSRLPPAPSSSSGMGMQQSAGSRPYEPGRLPPVPAEMVESFAESEIATGLTPAQSGR